MATPTQPGITTASDVLNNIDNTVANIRQEIAALPKRAESAGLELVEYLAKLTILRDDFGDLAQLPNQAAQDLQGLASVLEEVLHKVKRLGGFLGHLSILPFIESPESKIKRYQKRVEDAITCLSPFIASSIGQPQSSVPLQDNPSSTTSASPPQDHSAPPHAAPIWTKAIGPIRGTLKLVGAVAPVIPVVGQFVGYGVQVGNGLLDMFDGMSQNDEKALALSERVSRLSDVIAIFQDRKQTFYTSKSMLKYLEGFKTLCGSILDDIELLKAQARLGKLIFSSANAGTLSSLNSKIEEALRDLSMYLQLNSALVQQIQELERLLGQLGDGYSEDPRKPTTEGFCLEETRVEVLGRIDTWAHDPSSEQLLWIKGQVGRGKSTIARTATSRFAKAGDQSGLTAIFHFRRAGDAANTRVVSALASQIARGENDAVREVILQAVRAHHDIAKSPIDEQFKWLIVEPLQNLGDQAPPVLLVIDALDECGDQHFIRTLLRLIQEHSPSLPSVKFLITSRPESYIIKAFDNLPHRSEDLDKDDLEGDIIDRDLRTFYTKRLEQVEGLGDDLKRMDAVENLVKRSERLWQWADTVMNYIEESETPHIRLRKIIKGEVDVTGLNGLYTQILSDAFSSKGAKDPGQLELLRHVLGSLVLSPHPISLSILCYLYYDTIDPTTCSEQADEVHGEVLCYLRSLLIVPNRDSPDTAIHFIHTSVRDFLTDKEECKDRRFFIDPAAHHARLAKICFQRMKRDLRSDICAFQDPSQTNDDVLELVKAHVSPGLSHCCRSWSVYLNGATHDNSPEGCTGVHGLLDEFCQQQLLNWLEVLSLTGVLVEAITMAEQSRGWLVQRKETCAHTEECNTSDLLYDIRMFSVVFRQPISFSARHISRSAMVYCPRDTELWRRYGPSLEPGPRVVRGPVSQAWPKTVWIGRGHSDGVYGLAFSPDGTMLASGSDDNTIRLWNTASGTPIGQPLRGHSKKVTSIAFSPDGKLFASGSYDKTVCIWTTASGTPVGEPLGGHSGWVTSVAFSPDGKVLVSGSDDKTIRIWNLTSGEPIGRSIGGYSDGVSSLAFSPDGTILASGSSDTTICLRNPISGAPIDEPLRGHSAAVFSLAFSSDGKKLASGSWDKTIRIRNPTSRTSPDQLLEGHSQGVTSVAFLLGGTMLASGSWENTIRIWNPASGAPIGLPLEGHSSGVTSIASSPDGTMLASGSDDKTVRLWNPVSSPHIDEPLVGHSSYVRSMAFSPDGRMLASGSYDNTVRIWNPTTGTLIVALVEGHSSGVTSVAFSPDSTRLASGSVDNTICIWDLASGTCVGKALKGHSSMVTNVAFSRDGANLFSESNDGEKRTWNVPQADHVAPDSQSSGSPSITSKIWLYGHNDLNGRMGWVFRDGLPWFWMPEEFWLEGQLAGEVSFSGHTIAISHRNIHILDVSAIM